MYVIVWQAINGPLYYWAETVTCSRGRVPGWHRDPTCGLRYSPEQAKRVLRKMQARMPQGSTCYAKIAPAPEAP